MSPPDRLFRLSIWPLLVYVLFVVAICGGMITVRRQTLARLDTPQAMRQWQRWRNATQNVVDGESPVKRRLPSTDEPPAVILMRDYFTTCLVGAVLFGTLLLVVTLILLRGIFSEIHLPRANCDPIQNSGEEKLE